MNPTNRTRPSIIAAVIVAGVTTGNAYLAMVAFGIDNLGMNPGTAYVTAGVFELSLVTVALLAREAAKENRPGGVLLTLTWVLSGFSGAFAAIHEYDLGHGIGAVAFRVIVPMLAALMWHLALIGDRHLATGTTWVEIRRQYRAQRFYEDGEALFRANDTLSHARETKQGVKRATIAVKRAQTRLIASRHRARKAATPTELVGMLGALDASSAAETATLAAARENHARQMFAFQGATPPETIPATNQPNQVTNQPAQTGTPAPATIPATVRPNQRPATIPAPVFAQTVTPATKPMVATNPATNQATETGSGRMCAVCGNELPASAKATVRYCQGKREDGTRDQRCKNQWYSPKFKAARERAKLSNAVNAVTTQNIAFA